VYTESMCSTTLRPWTGAGAVNAWTVTGNYFEQRTGSNYGTGNVCGMEYKGGATLNALTGAMMANVSAINAAGTSGYVEFWVQSLTLDGTDGWTFQIDSGSGYVTRLSELTGSSHGWQKYHYDLASSELVSTLKMRFQFTGGGSGDDDRIDLDQITVTVTSGAVPVEVTMYDDGAHGDGAANDHVYGGLIPATAIGITISYDVTATDDSGLTASDPSTAPNDKYSYTVGRSTPQLKLNELMADSTMFVSTTDYPAQTVGLLTSGNGVWDGYTLMAPKHNTNTYLFDNAGRVVHSWASAYVPGQSVYLLANGHLLRSCMTTGPLSSGGGEGGRVEEYDWDGNLVWGYDYSSDLYMQHHDIKPLPNGNVLLLAVEKRTYQEALSAGFNPALLDSQIASKGYMLPDSVVEIQPVGSSGGNVVWKWSVWDHLIQNYASTKDNYGVPSAHPELIDPNGYAETGLIMQFWNHMNSIDYNPVLDQIMLSVRGSSEVWIIDHSTTTAQAAGHTGGNRGRGGDLLYRWGNPVTYDAGTAANKMLLDQHDAQWIHPGYPGAGHILVFNNGIGRNYSSVDEFVSPVDALGNYTLVTGSAYGPEALYWTYHAPNPTDLYSEAISGAQRLANGNTLMCDGVHGVLTEVTPAGETVWQYVNPEINTGILYQGDISPLDIRKHNYNAVFKVERYASDFAGFIGRDLTPGGPLELYRDWIEIKNPGSSAVDMSGMYLTNDLSTPTKWQVPTGVSIPAGGYLIFWADGQTTAGSRHMSFTLDKVGGSIALYDIDGITRVDSVTYGSQITNVSSGRYSDEIGGWCLMSSPTPGVANSNCSEAPLITDVTRVPATPTAADAVSVTAVVTDDSAVASVTLTYDAGSAPVSVPMYDNGTSGDGAAGDHVYGGQIPAQAGGTDVDYSVTVIDDRGLSSTATAESYSYSVAIVLPKQLPDGSPVAISGFIVTAAFDSFFYAEASDRSYGIRVDKPSHGLTIGLKADIVGQIQTTPDGERTIAASSVSTVGSGSIRPAATCNRWIGGGQSGYQGAVAPEGTGLNNIGLLLLTWGQVTGIDESNPETWFTIDDGSGINVKCVVPIGVTIDSSWQFATVTGISSCEKVGDELHRLLRVRSQEDLQAIGGP
ncbi:MAG: aryl-sulfate sulfotransferase, partial [Armatimonadota bacterium]